MEPKWLDPSLLMYSYVAFMTPVQYDVFTTEMTESEIATCYICFQTIIVL